MVWICTRYLNVIVSINTLVLFRDGEYLLQDMIHGVITRFGMVLRSIHIFHQQIISPLHIIGYFTSNRHDRIIQLTGIKQ